MTAPTAPAVPTTTRPIYAVIASLLHAIAGCLKAGNTEWEAKHRQRIREILFDHMPSGSGIDTGTLLDYDASTPEKLIFWCDFHHMNDAGMYDEWTHHKVIVRPSLAHGIDVRVTGRDRNGIKEYLEETYEAALQTLVDRYTR
jgi:hypothetical protein